MKIKKRSGHLVDANWHKLTEHVKHLANLEPKLTFVDPSIVTQKTISGLYDGVTTVQINELLAENAAMLSTKHYEYSYLASRILVANLHKNTPKTFGECVDILYNNKDAKTGEEAPLVSDKLISDFNVNKDFIEGLITPQLDYERNYFGLKTLYKSYLIKSNGNIVETPQYLYMRVAIGIHGLDKINIEKTYHRLAQGYYTHATPTLFNSGTPKPQMSSCFLLANKGDSLEGIMDTMKDVATISAASGGIGLAIHDIRAAGSYIKGSGGTSKGWIPLLKTYNELARFWDQGGNKRKGSFAMYGEPWHADVFELLDIRKNTGKEELRARELFPALWIPDLFMERVEADGNWTLMCPNECPGLSDVYGDEFKLLYERYEAENKGRKTIKAQELWTKILESQIETGTPYMLYKDAANSKSNQKNLGTIKSSNLCCIAGDQRVPTNKGLLSIKELYYERTENVVVGREKLETASKMLLPRPNAEMGIIETKQGYTHKVTPDHKVWVKDNGWVEASSLKLGDKILIQQYEGIWGKIDYEDEAFILGLLISDGCFSNTKNSWQEGVCLDLWNKNKFFIPKVEEIVKRIINKYTILLPNGKLQVFSKTFRKGTTTQPKFLKVIDKLGIEKYRLNSSVLGVIFNNLGINSKNKVSIPHFIWTANRKSISNFLESLYICDGSVQSKKGTCVSSYSSNNYKFLENLQILLSNFGIKSSICILREKGESLLPDGKGGNKVYSTKACWRLLVTSIKGNILLNKITHLGEYRNNKDYLEKIKKVGYEQKLFADFTKYQRLPNEDAYCLTVNSEEHSWTVNGVITKNTEILEYTSPTEQAVCNLASIAVNKCLVKEYGGKLIAGAKAEFLGYFFDHDLLYDLSYELTINLNKVIDGNHYPTPETKLSNLKHRPVGLGIQALADTFAMMNIAFDSEEAKELNNKIFETIYFASLTASKDLAIKDGPYESFGGSPASKGILQYDMWNKTEEVEENSNWNWQKLKQDITIHGIRNSLLLAPMPTASTASILDNNEAFEAYTSNLYTRRVLSGEFIMVNKHLVDKLVSLDLWNDSIINKLKNENGSVQNIPEIPTEVKEVFKTVWEISQKKILEMAADRGKFICQSQSMNVFMENANFGKLTSMHFYGWKLGLKTGMYYLRTKAAADAIKFTAEKEEIQEQISCSIDNPDDCEMCGA